MPDDPENLDRAASPPEATRGFRFDNSYARLPERFYAPVEPSAGRTPRLIEVNRPLAEELGVDPDWLASPAGADVLMGRLMPDGAQPIAMAYAGHQFGQFVPQLGDGRAILLGEVIDRKGRRRDIQLKGSGITPFSRRGDGRAPLGPVIREHVLSEAMAALGIPTTRSLGAVETGETVLREGALPGAVLTRVAASHVRVGTFQYFAARQDIEALQILSDYVIERHYPSAAEAEHPARALLAGVVERQAKLVAQWLLVGFIHGVMNTDNMSIAGETIDYGPCAFLDEYRPAAVFSSIDQFGRYAYANQPAVALWNLTRLAECLLPLIAEDQDEAREAAEGILSGFGPQFQAEHQKRLRRKIGLATEQDGDVELLQSLFDPMEQGRVDFTLFFRRLSEGGEQAESARAMFPDPQAFDAWADKWRARLAAEPREEAERKAAMLRVNPLYIPRNHLVEAAIRAALDNGDYEPFRQLHAVLTRPYEEQPGREDYARPPEEHERVRQTFCGT
jgi:uncharacterized protein YdiU (UPF0061 family)